MPSNNPSKVIKEGAVIDNLWQVLPEDTDGLPETPSTTIAPLSLWQRYPEAGMGVWLKNDVDLSAIAAEIIKAPVIAIEFPIFMDGRGFSIARLLRERYDYQGELRAIGHIIRDQLCYLKRCGFNTFVFNDDSVDLTAALASLNDFTEAYQTSVDQPLPLFRRRAS